MSRTFSRPSRAPVSRIFLTWSATQWLIPAGQRRKISRHRPRELMAPRHLPSSQLTRDPQEGAIAMLVGGAYRFRAGVDQRAGLKRFQAWQPLRLASPSRVTGPRPMAWEECSSPRSTAQPPRSRRPRLSPTKRNSKWSQCWTSWSRCRSARGCTTGSTRSADSS